MMGRRSADNRRGLRGQGRKRRARPEIVLVSLLALTACGGRSVHSGTSTESAGAGMGAAGAAAGIPGTGGSSAGRTGEDACAPLGNDPTRPPGRKGCYAFDEGAWVRLLCDCELPLENPSQESVAVDLSLVTSLDGTPLSFVPETRVDLSFDDLDGRYLRTWEAQPGHEPTFGVSRSQLETHVTLRAAHVTLQRVWLNPCEARYSQATVIGPDSMALSLTMSVTTTEGVVTRWTTDCGPTVAPPRP
jgi:hypothetical protein